MQGVDDVGLLHGALHHADALARGQLVEAADRRARRDDQREVAEVVAVGEPDGAPAVVGAAVVVEVALVILAVPPMITNAYLGVDSVEHDLVDAARGMGMSGGEVLRRVELPLAVPLVFAGIRTASVFVLSTTTIASLAGFSGSLGDIIANETSYHFSGVLGAAICVATLTLAVDAVLALVQRTLTPRGLRVLARERRAATRRGRVVAGASPMPS